MSESLKVLLSLQNIMTFPETVPASTNFNYEMQSLSRA